MIDRRAYPLNQSPFYKVTSPRRLAEDVFGVDAAALQELVDRPANYRIFDIKQNGKLRKVEEPKPELQSLHKRASILLARIETPDYLHSAIKGRSYLSNARAHLESPGLIKVDVRKFFQSVKRVTVADFFRRHMLCAPDVAGMLAKLLTIDGHLPTGSAVSPILSYYAHKDMFDEIEALANTHGLKMTCYVDDMCLSGAAARRWILFQVRGVIARHGLRSHKAHYFGPTRPRIVTGVVIHRGRALLPNRRHKKISEEYKILSSSRHGRREARPGPPATQSCERGSPS